MDDLRDLMVPPGTTLMRDPRNVAVRDLEESDRVALLGVPWDWGITGRPGSRHSPAKIRSYLYSMKTFSPVHGELRFAPRDLGDVKIAPGDWETTGKRVTNALQLIYSQFPHVIILGGDHSITEWTLTPLLEEYERVGLILLDAHYDMRSVEEGYTSGLWLYNLVKKYRGKLVASIVGIGEYANPPYLAERAEEAGFKVIPAQTVLNDPSTVYDAIEYIEGEADAYYISIDMDHIDQAFAPGVNSPSHLGLYPQHTIMLLEEAIPVLCPKGVDIVEVVPHLDVADATVRLSALIAAKIHHLFTGACK
ncbi:MAG: arginase family protein [Desulfurococcales archaeon]|nr:arginase family protein [Desulfurococcales archaeon]MCE4622360.1 arginase family protein [Desulfurococcales archaeon]MCE4626820.1 arginase family protein [Desulfurococcales archaeon]MCE4629604.1 arginase family protein [Desulfurococcales archaeon]